MERQTETSGDYQDFVVICKRRLDQRERVSVTASRAAIRTYNAVVDFVTSPGYLILYHQFGLNSAQGALIDGFIHEIDGEDYPIVRDKVDSLITKLREAKDK